jgi:hypothetical protein
MVQSLNRAVAIGLLLATAAVAGDPMEIRESFDQFDASRFAPAIPNESTQVRNGALWTRGGPAKGYPPMVAMPIEATDLEISFRYRQLGDGEYVWLLVDGDDGFGGNDHVFRVQLQRGSVQLQVDGHTLDPDDPQIQKFGGPRIDKVSGSYRTNELLPKTKLDLSDDDWHQLHVVFEGEHVAVTLDETTYRQSVQRPGFDVAKTKLLWLLNGGEAGIELDDIHVRAVSAAPATDDR